MSDYSVESDPRFVSDMADYFEFKGKRIIGAPYRMEVDGGSEWSGGCETCAFEIRSVTVELWSRDEAGVHWYSIEDFDMGEFMRFVYDQMGVSA